MQQPSEIPALPSFSCVLETENLANADIAGLAQSLASLATQTLPITVANEVLIIDSGDTPIDLLDRLCQQYPWLKVHQAPTAIDYYKAKMLGAELVTGQIVVYADSDCIYEPTWLQELLAPFVQSEQIQVVAGETTTRGTGAYGTAMALTYIFPPYSDDRAIVPTTQYFLNNVAFRREFLLKHPIPDQLPLYRGNCVLHANGLRQQGYTIWRQPNARATHAPPSDRTHFFWRFLLIGHDYYWQRQLLPQPTQPQRQPATINPTNDHDPIVGGKGKMSVFGDRINKLVRRDRRHLAYLPVAMPIVLTAALLIFIGYTITSFKSDYLLKTYDRLLLE